jgi:methenyltetrahydrofolate cyclohydrolase
MTLVDQSVREFLAALASSDPAPGGGSASAAAAAMGASLLRMVAALPKTRTGADEDRAALRTAASALASIQTGLAGAIDEDTSAYNGVVAAYKLARATDADKAARTQAIQRALHDATEVPLQVMRLALDALTQAVAVAAHGYRAAASDVGVAVALLGAGLHGARLNVDINLEGLSDPAYKTAVAAEAARVERDAAAAADAAQKSMRA